MAQGGGGRCSAGSSKSPGRLPFPPARHAGPLAPAPRGGSPDLKASGLSWAPGSQALMGPMAEASWYWVSSRCSCAGLRVGNAARKFAQLIWGTRRSLWSGVPPPWHSHTPGGASSGHFGGRSRGSRLPGHMLPAHSRSALASVRSVRGSKSRGRPGWGEVAVGGGSSQQAPHPVLCPPDMLLVTLPRGAEKGGRETCGLGEREMAFLPHSVRDPTCQAEDKHGGKAFPHLEPPRPAL